MIVIIPLADQHGDDFEIYFNGQKQRLALPLEFNGLLVLRPLAFHLGVPEARTMMKPELLVEIKRRLSFVPNSEACREWPALGRVQKWTESCDFTWETIEENLAIMRDLIPRVQARTPWLLPHALVTVEWIAEYAGALARCEEAEAAKAAKEAEAAKEAKETTQAATEA